ncbi:MAG: DNA polymerase IV, partial [Methylococcales bacterium]
MYWPRVIILVDMNAFFASVEQMDRAEWQGRPIAVTNGVQGTTIITSSYEARAWGVRTGMRLKQARILCPELIQAPA